MGGLFCLSCFCSLFVFFVFWWFKGQVRWPKGPHHLAPNPPYFLVCSVLFSFCGFVFLFIEKENPVFPTEKRYCCLFFRVSLYFLPSCFTPPLSLSLSLYPSLVSFILPSLFSFFLSFFFASSLKWPNLAQVLTPQHIYIYIYVL